MSTTRWQFAFIAIGALVSWNLVDVSSSLADDKAQETQIEDIKLQVPASWKKTPATSRLRLAQFEIPAAEGDKEPAELVIFSFGGAGGGVEANVKRWTDQFRAEGRKSETREGKAPQGQYVLVDVSGTYNKPVGPPVLQKTEPLPNARMLAVILAVEKKGNYFLRLTGPEKTVTATADAFRRSFGGNAEQEKPWHAENK